jgi:hypothetical protein
MPITMAIVPRRCTRRPAATAHPGTLHDVFVEMAFGGVEDHQRDADVVLLAHRLAARVPHDVARHEIFEVISGAGQAHAAVPRRRTRLVRWNSTTISPR